MRCMAGLRVLKDADMDGPSPIGPAPPSADRAPRGADGPGHRRHAPEPRPRGRPAEARLPSAIGEEEPHHLAARVRPPRIGVRTLRAAPRPGVAEPLDAPELHLGRGPLPPRDARARSVGHGPSPDRSRGLGRAPPPPWAKNSPFTGCHGPVGGAVEHDRRHAQRGRPVRPARPAMAEKAPGMSRAAPAGEAGMDAHRGEDVRPRGPPAPPPSRRRRTGRPRRPSPGRTARRAATSATNPRDGSGLAGSSRLRGLEPRPAPTPDSGRASCRGIDHHGPPPPRPRRSCRCPARSRPGPARTRGASPRGKRSRPPAEAGTKTL